MPPLKYLRQIWDVTEKATESIKISRIVFTGGEIIWFVVRINIEPIQKTLQHFDGMPLKLSRFLLTCHCPHTLAEYSAHALGRTRSTCLRL